MPRSEDPVVHQYRPQPIPAPAPEPRREAPARIAEIGGRRDGTDPTRYGDWEKQGRCVDF